MGADKTSLLDSHFDTGHPLWGMELADQKNEGKSEKELRIQRASHCKMT